MANINATARWPEQIVLNSTQISILNDLREAAIKIEEGINNQCIQLLKKAGIEEISDGHGEAIKQFFYNFYKTTNRYDSSKVFTSYIDKYADELNKAIGLNQDELIEYGIGSLMDELKRNLGEKNITYARGNYAELHLFEGLYNGLKAAYGDNVVISDTSPREYGDSIRYDINILLSLPDEDDLDINIESKKGISNTYTDSRFDLGTFSDTGFSFKKNEKTYASLIDSLQQDFYNFIRTSTKSTQATDAWVQEQLVDWSIQYINWRINHNFPIFASDVDGGKINLSSEIIQGFKTNPGGFVEYVLGDMFTFVLLDNTYKYGGGLGTARYTSSKGQIDKKVLEEYVKGSGWLERTNYDNVFKKGTKITPLFKATVWYGK